MAEARFRGSPFHLSVIDAASEVAAMTRVTVAGSAPSVNVDAENEQALDVGTPAEQNSETGPLNVLSVLDSVSVKVAV